MITEEVLQARSVVNHTKMVKQRAQSYYYFYLRVRKMFSRQVDNYDVIPVTSLDGYNIPSKLHKWVFELESKYLDNWSSNPDKNITMYKYHFIRKEVPNQYYPGEVSITLKQEYR